MSTCYSTLQSTSIVGTLTHNTKQFIKSVSPLPSLSSYQYRALRMNSLLVLRPYFPSASSNPDFLAPFKSHLLMKSPMTFFLSLLAKGKGSQHPLFLSRIDKSTTFGNSGQQIYLGSLRYEDAQGWATFMVWSYQDLRVVPSISLWDTIGAG